MGRKKNKQKRNKTSLNGVDNGEVLVDKEISCEKQDVFLNNEEKLLTAQPQQQPTTSSNNGKSEIENDGVSSKEGEVTFEKYRPNTERLLGREYFIHSLCQVCKEELKTKVTCPECKMINYCSQAHRRQHWPIHADLCGAIAKVCVDRKTDHIMQGSLGCSADDFRVFRYQNMVQCEATVGRPLESWEREMFIFPNVCGTCHEFRAEHLITCDGCKHSGFCKDHRNQRHSEWCKLLLLYRNIIRDQYKFGVVSPIIPNTKLSLVPPNVENIKQVFKGIANYIDFFEFVELTEITTYPITALYALLKNKNQQPKDVTLHVVGAEADFEINKPEKWEYYILHLMPEIESLDIVFIGPELKPTPDQKTVTVCSKCKAAKKSIAFKFQQDFYHIFARKSRSSKPQLICVFNPGLYRTTGFNNEDTWSPSIVSMFAMGCPVLVTAYTHKEILLDVQRVRQTQNIVLHHQPTLNPFSSLKPNLNFVSDEESPVIFKNQYFCIMCKA